MSIGTAGFATAVTLLMVLAPASAGGIHALKVYTPTYKHTVNQPGAYWSVSGCAKAKVTTAKWSAVSGTVKAAASTSASTCGKSLGTVGGSSYANGESYMTVGIPVMVGSSGNHSVASSWTLSLGTTSSYTSSACPAKNVNYHPALNSYSYAYCEAGTYLSVDVSSSITDLSNSSWYGNYSYGDSYNESAYENYTECYNYGTPTCYNGTSYHYANTYGYNEAGFSAFTWNGATTFSLWNNGTHMVKSHHYVLVISVYFSTEAFAEQANLLGPWAGSAVASMNGATLGNGATLNSVSIV
ncbi:MAG: hypothetical protein L3K19_05730 [Thermoplasmata archaeon]|nr:hypothetical protein [Thermoplasmata archaeon]